MSDGFQFLSFISEITIVEVYTDPSDKKPHRQVGLGKVMTSRSLDGVMVNVVVCTDLSGKEPQTGRHGD